MIVHMLKSRPLLWCIAGLGLIVLAAGISAGVAKGSLPGPGWLVAGATGATLALAATTAALRPVFVKVVQGRVDRSIRRADAAQELRERLGDAKGRFPRVSDIRDRALLYGVQQAIPLDDGPVEGLSADLPRYLPRTIDGSLRSALTARSATGGMVILKGNSTWGKTRCMFEAVNQVLGDRFIVAPTKASDIHDLVQSGLPLKQYVVWLDELVDFLVADDPLTRPIIKRAVDRGAIIVGTIWKDDFAALTDPPKKANGDGSLSLGLGSGRVDELAEARAILTATYADLIEMPRDLDENETAVASALATEDPRWAHALADAGELSPIQLLAAAPQLLHRYRSPDNEAGGVVLRAAVALLAMEHPNPVPAQLLRRVAQAKLPPTMEVASDAWFDEALAWARRPVRGTIAPLKVYRSDLGDQPGYVTSDILISAAREDGGLQDQVDLDVTVVHATAEACAAIGGYFYFQDEEDVAEPLLRRAAESGVVRTFRQYGYVLGEVEGRAAEAEKWYLKAVDAGYTSTWFNLGVLLGEQEGREAEAEEWYRKAAETGDVAAIFGLGYLLSRQEGREAEAEQWYRKSVDAGEVMAMFGLGSLLSRQEGREAEAEQWYRNAADAGETTSMRNLGMLLSEQEGREAEAERWIRKAVDAGEEDAMVGLAWLLSEQEGREAEAEEWCRKAVAAGEDDAMFGLGSLLIEQEGREAEAQEWFRKAADAGSSAAMFNIGALLNRQEGREVEVEEWWRRAADAGESRASFGLGVLLNEQEGREAEAEEWYRKAADAGNVNALSDLGGLLTDQGKYKEARSILERGIEAGDPYAMWTMAELDLVEGRREEARVWLEKAAALEVDGAAEFLAEELGEDPSLGE